MSLALKIVLAVVSVILTISIQQQCRTVWIHRRRGGTALRQEEKPGIRRFAQQDLNSDRSTVYRTVTGTCCAGVVNITA